MGAYLQWARPEIVDIDCDDCHLVVYDLATGEPTKWRGEPAPRKQGNPPPCVKKCPKGGPDKYSTLLPQNMECLQHYMECSATGSFPDDPIVRRHAAILRNIEHEVDRLKRREDINLIAMHQRVTQVADMATKAKRV